VPDANDHEATPKPHGEIKRAPEDFRVDELPLYEPSGKGDHLYIRFRKRLLTTDEAARAIGRALDVPPRDIGVAGLKDKVAVTTQTISLPVPRGESGEAFAARAGALALSGIEVLDARLHGNKLKTGHLAGNAFSIVVRGVPNGAVEPALEALARIAREGVPNHFGAQRFGARGDNAERARAWLSGKERGPRDARAKRFLWSSLQSAMFNAVLDARVNDGTWNVPLAGDVLKRRDSGGLFLCTDEPLDRERALRGEVVPTGPLFGVKMKCPEGAPAALERSVLHDFLGNDVDLAQTRPFGEGTRRALCLWVDGLTAERELANSTGADPGSARPDAALGASIRVRFVLPKGAYATTVLGTVFALAETRTPDEASFGIDGPEGA
jgi:tRNA pseudouridine13 synthase